VNVFLTGLSIYAENEAYRKAFDSAVPEKDYIYAYQTPHEEFFFRWGVAALFHDVGYPVEIVGHQINRFIRMVADADGDEVRIKAQIRFENFSELNHIREVVPKRPFTRAYYDAYESCSYIDLLTPNDLLAHHVHQTLGTDLMETKKAVDFAGSFSFKGTPSDKLNVYYCFLKKDQTDANAFSNIGVRADAFEALGTRLAERYTNLDKLYVCVTDVANGWDHSLSSAMNELIGKVN
jgi:hypothetical protein